MKTGQKSKKKPKCETTNCWASIDTLWVIKYFCDHFRFFHCPKKTKISILLYVTAYFHEKIWPWTVIFGGEKNWNYVARKSGVDGAVHMLIANIYFHFILELVTKNKGKWQKIPKIDYNALYTTMYKVEYGTYQNGTPSI